MYTWTRYRNSIFSIGYLGMVQDYRLLGSNSFLNHFISMEKKFTPKLYKHFDIPVSRKILRTIFNASFVQRSFYPMIKIEKKKNRIVKKNGKICKKPKARTIMYASHTDSLIYKFIGFIINSKLEDFYREKKLCNNIAAYRSKYYTKCEFFPKSNYEWAAYVYKNIIKKLETDKRIKLKNDLCIITSDIEDFFGSINHKILKQKLCKIMQFDEIPDDWYCIFKNVTKYSFVSKDLVEKFSFVDEKKHFSIKKLKENGIKIEKNKDSKGIPQGNPISSTLSNLYMIDFDCKIIEFCKKRNIIYIRYSDDIIFICRESQRRIVKKILRENMESVKLNISKEKTHCTLVSDRKNNSFNYLGFTIDINGATLRSSSLSKILIRFQKTHDRTMKKALKNQNLNISKCMYTKNLYRKFSTINYYNKKINKNVYADNFFSYARRSAKEFDKVGGDNITNQINKMERKISKKICDTKILINNLNYINI